ncbi:MAG: hypothetical protein PF637_08715 [Spirochaetes bacterium]|jgi:hypothetical protein|nr:hypothetical protein [Spirochaetota bacterium]
MEIKTVWGVTWYEAGMREITIMIIVLLIIAIVLLLIRTYFNHNKSLNHEYQYILFQTKNRGLTNFQYKIVRGMAEILKLKHPVQIIESKECFEKSIASFILFLTKNNKNDSNSLMKIFKSIVITYEKLFSETGYKRPMTSIDEISDGRLIYFYTDPEFVFIGKLFRIENSNMVLKLFRRPRELKLLKTNLSVTCYIWRAGDAEYTFQTTVTDIAKNMVILQKPSEIIRGKEVRLPFVNIIIPGTVIISKSAEEEETLNVTVFKLAEHEIVLRLSEDRIKADNCIINFTLEDFSISTPATILTEKTISEQDAVYYTLKFTEVSKPAEKVIRNYIYEHI